MKIFTRTQQLVTASLHDWFDRLERPEQMARHGLRELGSAIESATSAAARSIAAERWLERRRAEQQRQIELLEQRAAEAVRAGSDAAARRALVQQFELQRSMSLLDRQLAEATEVNRGLRAQLDTMRSRYHCAEHQLDLGIARHTLARTSQQFADSSRTVAGSHSALGDLQRALDRVEHATLEAEVHAELCEDISPDFEQQFTERQREQFVDDELQRMRSTTPVE